MDDAGISIGLSNGWSDLDGILELQRENHRARVTTEEGARNGFVTVEHTRAILEQMHRQGPSLVARRGERVVGYALTMTLGCRPLLAVLEPMFARLEQLEYRGRALNAWEFYVMGQVCVAAAERGKGVFDELYQGHRDHFSDRYQLLVTEISARNGRSLRAHARVGFGEVARYRDETDDWVIVALDLRATSDVSQRGS